MGILSKLKLLAALALTLVIASCLSSEDEARPSSFSHAVHVGQEQLDCRMCHSTARSGLGAGMPGPQICAPCHDRIDADKDAGHQVKALFDVSGRWTEPPVAALADELRFDHRAHAAEDCSACHAGIANSAGLPTPSIGKDDCMSCHTERGASNDCAVCHTYVRREWVPPTHELGWQERHGHAARNHNQTIVDRCFLCHEEHTSCKACHQEMLPRDHTAFWRIRGHGIGVSIDRSRCATCHRTDFCERCHEYTRPLSHTPGWGSPSDRHCNGCHFPLGDTSRITCHKGAPSHGQSPPMPPWHDPAMNCRLCHGNGEPLPHPDPGTECTRCHR